MSSSDPHGEGVCFAYLLLDKRLVNPGTLLAPLRDSATVSRIRQQSMNTP